MFGSSIGADNVTSKILVALNAALLPVILSCDANDDSDCVRENDGCDDGDTIAEFVEIVRKADVDGDPFIAAGVV